MPGRNYLHNGIITEERKISLWKRILNVFCCCCSWKVDVPMMSPVYVPVEHTLPNPESEWAFGGEVSRLVY